MKLFLMRHGLAASAAGQAGRSLTELGRQEIKRVAEFLRKQGIQIGEIWRSPKLRSAQTAEIVATVLQPKPEVLEKSGLEPDDPVRSILEAISRQQQDLLIVGHLPNLAKIGSALLAPKGAREIIQFRSGSVACLERSEDTPWRFAWMITPELIDG